MISLQLSSRGKFKPSLVKSWPTISSMVVTLHRRQILVYSIAVQAVQIYKIM